MTTDSAIPAEFWQGVNEFNTGDFYACHDTWEAIWMESIDPERTFYQGLIQIAVSLYHLNRYNWQGCVTLMGEGIRRLAPYQPDYFEIEVTPLIESAQHLLRTLQLAGPENVEAIAVQVISSHSSTSPNGSDSAADGHSHSHSGSVEQLPQEPLRSPTITRMMGI